MYAKSQRKKQVSLQIAKVGEGENESERERVQKKRIRRECWKRVMYACYANKQKNV